MHTAVTGQGFSGEAARPEGEREHGRHTAVTIFPKKKKKKDRANDGDATGEVTLFTALVGETVGFSSTKR
jgi:hypothetical protein